MKLYLNGWNHKWILKHTIIVITYHIIATLMSIMFEVHPRIHLIHKIHQVYCVHNIKMLWQIMFCFSCTTPNLYTFICAIWTALLWKHIALIFKHILELYMISTHNSQYTRRKITHFKFRLYCQNSHLLYIHWWSECWQPTHFLLSERSSS